MLSYWYRNSHYKEKIILSYLYNGNHHNWKHSLSTEMGPDVFIHGNVCCQLQPAAWIYWRTKWPHLAMAVLNAFPSIKIFVFSLKLQWVYSYPKVPADNKSSLLQVMPWLLIGEKPSSEPMMTQFTYDWLLSFVIFDIRRPYTTASTKLANHWRENTETKPTAAIIGQVKVGK